MGSIKQIETAINNNKLRTRVLESQRRLYEANFTVMGATSSIKAFLLEKHQEYYTNDREELLNHVLNSRAVDQTITIHIEEAVTEILK